MNVSRTSRAVATTVLSAAAAALVVSAALAQETRVARKDLPAAVEKTVARLESGAKVRGFSKEIEHGVTYYEAELTVSGRSRDVLMDAQGAVVEVEEEVALDSLPAAVKSGIVAQAAGGKVLRVESLTKSDKLVAYEAVVEAKGKRSEVKVAPDGKPVADEEDGEEADDDN